MHVSLSSSSFSTLEYETTTGMICSRYGPTLWPLCRLKEKVKILHRHDK